MEAASSSSSGGGYHHYSLSSGAGNGGGGGSHAGTAVSVGVGDGGHVSPPHLGPPSAATKEAEAAVLVAGGGETNGTGGGGLKRTARGGGEGDRGGGMLLAEIQAQQQMQQQPHPQQIPPSAHVQQVPPQHLQPPEQQPQFQHQHQHHQQQQQTPGAGAAPGIGFMMLGATGPLPSTPPLGPHTASNGSSGPLFERFSMEDRDSLRECHQMIDTLQRRVADLESVNLDLEHRLESEAKERILIEHEIAETGRRWSAKYAQLEAQTEELRKQCSAAEVAAERYKDQVRRTEREMHGMLVKKYDMLRQARQQHMQQHPQQLQQQRQRAQIMSRGRGMSDAADPSSAGGAGSAVPGVAPRDETNAAAVAAAAAHEHLHHRPRPPPGPPHPEEHHPDHLRDTKVFANLCDFFGI